MGTKHIADPVYGAIDLEDVEVAVIDTPTFQRLRRIRQLAMVSQVYPGADHSRFLHSIGVLAIMARVVERLRKTIPEKDAPKLRLAALLHDIGHYPYSHLLEKLPLPGTEKSKAIDALVKGVEGKAAPSPGGFPPHDELSAYLIKHRADVRSVLIAHGFEPDEIASMIRSTHRRELYSQLISSGLDADRLDYMLRDAHYSGVPYGNIDLHYIIRNLELDDRERLCVSPKAVASVEHFLLSRWYNYGQIVYQKTVMGMETLMRRLLEKLVRDGSLPSTPEKIIEMANGDEFLTFDDTRIDGAIRQAALESDHDDPCRLMARAIIHRVKPRLVFESFMPVSGNEPEKNIERVKRNLDRKVSEWARRFTIRKDYWLIADSKSRSLEELRPRGSFTDEESDAEEVGTTDERAKQRAKLIRVKKPDGKSTPIMDEPTSLLHPLKDAAFRVVRMYILMPEEVKAVMDPPKKKNWRGKYKDRAKQIGREIRDELGLED